MLTKTLRSFITLGSTLIVASSLLGSSVVGIKSLNNSTKDSDFKITEEYLKKVGDKLNNTSDIKEYFTYTQDKDTSGFEKEIAYLLEHDIITREGTIEITNKDVKYKKGQVDLKAKMSESDFLMGLYKAKWGVIESRPLVIKTSATRKIKDEDITVVHSDEYKPNGYEGNETSFDFDGDYYIYVSPNVNEIYLANLLNKGIVPRERLEGGNYLREFDNIGTRPPSWYPSTPIEIYNPNGVNPLGNSWTVSIKDDKVILTKKDSQIFTTETMTKLDALKYVASVLRLTEREMSDTEATIVSYKYGVDYLSNIPKEDADVVRYLIAMGIIDFEDKEEVSNLYDSLTVAFAYDLFYRVNNIAGRHNFTAIQLTDNDNFWLNKGYGESTLNIYKLKSKDFSDVLDTEIRELTELAEINPVLYELEQYYNPLGLEPVTKTSAVSKTDSKAYEIIRYFPQNTSFTYRGVKISDLAGKSAGDPEDFVKCTLNETTKKYEVTFKVKASNETSALLLLDSNTSYSGSDIKEESQVKAVTKMKTGDKDKDITLVSASSLANISSDLQILEDKVLMNKASGALALLLPDNDLAIVGTKVIRSEDIMVFSANGEKYYNLEIISSLLTNGFISTLDDQSIYITRDNSGGLFNDTNFIKVFSSNDTAIDLTNLVKLKNVGIESGDTDSVNYFNVTLMQQALNTITIDDFNATFVIDWSYIVPEENQGDFADVNANPTLSEMTKFFYARPEGELAKWWDANLILGNAIANWVYGTSGVEYITCGYLAPTINILAKDRESGEKAMNDMFDKLELPSDYLLSYTGSSTKHKLLGTEFNAVAADSSSMYDQLKTSRKLNIFTKSTNNIEGLSNGECYTNFLKLANGSIYRNVDADGRVLLGKADGKDALFVKTRAVNQSQVILWKNAKYQGYEFNIRGMGGGNENDDKHPKDMYYKLLSTNAVSGTIKNVGDNKYELDNKVLDKGIQAIKEVFGSGVPESFFWEPKEAKDKYESPVISGFIKKSGYYLHDGDIYYFVVKDSAVTSHKKLTPEEVKKEVLDANKAVYAYPVVWVHKNMLYYDEETGQLMIGKVNPYLSSSNLFYAGLNRAVIDSVIAHSVGTVKVNDLKEGNTLVVGDLVFVKENGVFKSHPISDSTVVQGMLGSNDIEATAGKAFTGMVLDYSGRQVPLIEAITSASLGQLPKGVAGEKTLIKSGSLKMIKDGNKETNFSSSSEVKTVAINVKFGNNVLCRKLDDKSKYVLVHSTNFLSDGYLANAPFFNESLSLGVKDDIFTDLNKSKFSPISNFLGSMDSFKEQMKDLRHQDIKQVIKIILVLFCWWFVIISWVVYAVLRFGIGVTMLEMFRNPNRITNKDGFDLVKIVSLGVYNLDMVYSPGNPQSVKLSNFLVGSIFATLISYILIRFF